MKHFALFLLAAMFLSFISFDLGLAQTFYTPKAAAIRAVEILKSEIARDEEILLMPMNNIRLTMARRLIAPGLAQKKNLIDNFTRLKMTELSTAIAVLRQTLADEESIAGNTRTVVYIRIRTKRMIQKNVTLKKTALDDFEKWLADSDKK